MATNQKDTGALDDRRLDQARARISGRLQERREAVLAEWERHPDLVGWREEVERGFGKTTLIHLSAERLTWTRITDGKPEIYQGLPWTPYLRPKNGKSRSPDKARTHQRLEGTP